MLASYHDDITQAFIISSGDSAFGRRLANDGRDAILDAVIVPFNSSYGQAKKGSGIGGLTSAAQRRFDEETIPHWVSPELKARLRGVLKK